MGSSKVSILSFLSLAVVGKLLIYLFQQFPPAVSLFSKTKTTKKLISCDLCLGVWIYWFLSLITKMNILEWFYVPVISELITGSVLSFGMHLMSIGYKDKFGTIVFEENKDAA